MERKASGPKATFALFVNLKLCAIQIKIKIKMNATEWSEWDRYLAMYGHPMTEIQAILIKCCLSASLASIILHWIIYLTVSKLRNLPAKLMLSLLTALGVSCIQFLAIPF